MAQPSYLNIIRRTVDSWDFESDLYPEPHGADGYHGNTNGDGTISFTDRNGTNTYNRISYEIIEYIDEYGSNNYTPSSAEGLMYFLKAEGFFASGSGGGGGSDTFIGLTDVSVPGGYVANVGKIPIITSTGLVMTNPSFAFQNNIGKTQTITPPVGTEFISTVGLANYINENVSISVSETQVVLLQINYFNDEGFTAKKEIYFFKAGKGDWGLGGTPTTSGHYFLIVKTVMTPEDVYDTPNSFIYDLGDTTGTDFWEAGNDQDPPYNLTDSGDLDVDGNPRTYFFSYTDSGVLYYAKFIGAQGLYGLGESQFVEADFVDTTNDTVTPLPNLEQVTAIGNTTTHGVVATGGGYQISYTNQTIEFRDISGNTLRLRMPASLLAGEVTFDFPLKTADDTFAMLSDLGGLLYEYALSRIIPTSGGTFNITETSFEDGEGISRMLMNIFVENTGTYTINLPDPDTLVGKEIFIIKTNSDAGDVVISAANLISGLPTITLSNQYDYIHIKIDPDTYYVVGSNLAFLAPGLDQVLTSGNESNKDIILKEDEANKVAYTNTGLEKIKDEFSTKLDFANPTANNTQTFQDKSGTVAVTTDITDALTDAIFKGSDSDVDVEKISAMVAFPGSPVAKTLYFVESKDFEGSITGTSDGVSTTVVVPHTLGVVPTYVNIVAKNALAAGFTYVTADASNITINYGSAPAAGSPQYWARYIS